MRADEGRTIGLYFKVTPEEAALSEKKMELAGTKNKRAYLRKMAVDGYIIQLDMESMKKLTRLLSAVSNNVNQIARRCNETRNLYKEDVDDLKEGYTKIRTEVLQLLRKFADL